MTSYDWKMPLLSVMEIRNLFVEKSGNFTFFDAWKPCMSKSRTCTCTLKGGFLFFEYQVSSKESEFE